MPGFSNISGDESIMFANNVSFDGTERGGKLTTDGQLLIGATASPHIRTGLITSTDGSITVTSGAGTIDLSGAVVTATQYQTDSGTATPSSDILMVLGGEGIDVTGGSNVVTVRGEDASSSNKGVASFDSGDFTVVNGNVTLSATGAGQTITGDAGGALAPAAGNWSILGGTNGIDTSGSGSTLTINFDVSEAPTIPTSIATGSGTATPSTNSFTIAGAGTVTTSGSGSTVTITGTGGGLTWTVITADQNITVANGYVCNKAGTLTLTLPASAVAGDSFRVTGINTATGWKVAQNANQQIFIGTSSTTVGAGGSIASINIRDSIECVCVVAGASTVWNVISGVGNFTIV